MTGNSILIIISILILILSAHILYKKIENQILHLSPPNWVLLEITFVFQIVNHFLKKILPILPALQYYPVLSTAGVENGPNQRNNNFSQKIKKLLIDHKNKQINNCRSFVVQQNYKPKSSLSWKL